MLFEILGMGGMGLFLNWLTSEDPTPESTITPSGNSPQAPAPANPTPLPAPAIDPKVARQRHFEELRQNVNDYMDHIEKDKPLPDKFTSGRFPKQMKVLLARTQGSAEQQNAS